MLIDLRIERQTTDLTEKSEMSRLKHSNFANIEKNLLSTHFAAYFWYGNKRKTFWLVDGEYQQLVRGHPLNR